MLYEAEQVRPADPRAIATARANLAEHLLLLQELDARAEGLLFLCPASYLRALPYLLRELRDPAAFPEFHGARPHLAWLMNRCGDDLEGVFRHHSPTCDVQSLFRNAEVHAESWLEGAEQVLALLGDEACRILPLGRDTIPDTATLFSALSFPVFPEQCAPIVDTRIPSRELFSLYLSMRFFSDRHMLAFRTLLREVALRGADPQTFLPPEPLGAMQELYGPRMDALLARYGISGRAELSAEPFANAAPRADAPWQPFVELDQARSAALWTRVLEASPPELRKVLMGSALGDQKILARVPAAQRPSVPLLTVLTLTRDHEKYIAACMEGVLAQKTVFPVRHIIFDDQSADATREIISEYAERYDSILPVRSYGAAALGQNVQTLFSLCRSKYAALCDGDDYFTDPLKLQKQVDFLEANPDCALCFHPVRVVYEDGSAPDRVYPTRDLLPGGYKARYSLQDLLQGNFIQTNSVVYRWRFTAGLPDFFRPDLLPGDWYWHLLHAETGAIGFLPEALSVYRRHAGGLFHTTEHTTSSVAHRKTFGLRELELYDAVNKHFHLRYSDTLNAMAIGPLCDFLQLYLDTGDDSLLVRAGDLFPDFTRNFLRSVHATGT